MGFQYRRPIAQGRRDQVVAHRAQQLRDVDRLNGIAVEVQALDRLERQTFHPRAQRREFGTAVAAQRHLGQLLGAICHGLACRNGGYNRVGRSDTLQSLERGDIAMHRYRGQLRIQVREHVLDRGTLEVGQRARFATHGAIGAVLQGCLGPTIRSRLDRVEEVREVDRIQERGQLRDVVMRVAHCSQRDVVLQLDAAQFGGRNRQQLRPCQRPTVTGGRFSHQLGKFDDRTLAQRSH
ncbi:hypothetical protein [Burkholderia vietnamiensis]|uniref:hypothetical protein n=1 Tax=Burkholderia vietnamiensis TaxID=60552 RepID=UPI001FC9C0AB|nr:hypothetical protein [Burkholderia vietnamiensis]